MAVCLMLHCVENNILVRLYLYIVEFIQLAIKCHIYILILRFSLLLYCYTLTIKCGVLYFMALCSIRVVSVIQCHIAKLFQERLSKGGRKGDQPSKNCSACSYVCS